MLNTKPDMFDTWFNDAIDVMNYTRICIFKRINFRWTSHSYLVVYMIDVKINNSDFVYVVFQPLDDIKWKTRYNEGI